MGNIWWTSIPLQPTFLVSCSEYDTSTVSPPALQTESSKIHISLVLWLLKVHSWSTFKVRTTVYRMFMINRLTKFNTSTTSRRFLPRKDEMLPWLSSVDRLKKQRPYCCKLDSHTGQYRWISTSSIGTGKQHAIYSVEIHVCRVSDSFYFEDLYKCCNILNVTSRKSQWKGLEFTTQQIV